MTEKYRPVRDIKPAPAAMQSIKQAGHPIFRSVIAFVSVLVLLVSGLGYFAVGKVGDVANAGNLTLGGGKGVLDGQAEDGATDILLVGSDSRSDAQGNSLTEEELALLRAGDEENDNTDTIMVIRIPNDGSSATAVSIPRDTYVHDSDYGNMKINGVYGAHKDARRGELMNQGFTNESELEKRAKESGREGLIGAVSDLTGVTVDHYAEIGLLGFVLLTDAVGGVEVCLNNAVDEPLSGANFPAGRQFLGGPDALSYVRQRHDLPRGDLDRIVRQQSFMASLVNQVLSSGTLTNPSKLSALADAVTRSVIIDEGWDVMGFATQLQNLAGGNVTFGTIPVTSIDGTGDYGESVVTVDVNQVHTFFNDALGGSEPAVEAGSDEQPAEDQGPDLSEVEVHVLNASYTEGLANGIAAHLQEMGYTIAETGNAAEGLYYESQVLAGDANSKQAEAISEALGGLPIMVNSSLDANTVIVVSSGDYAGPTAESNAVTSSTVGQPGADIGAPIESPEFDAGGDGPRCVN
ncbi:cell wall biosynthesis protein LcpA [Corynebacterium crudilactis]|uniref:LytR family transcriptional regulator n=1 Tax=Corynebacterium crudilactis TaxID=1652495 RepID=A0A172QRT4_9CORY|nr:cell wall biosynthesis protein LcpA [Corynebacterium crudilactis]ANE03394.1 LytR family transcriptional regulator [Corynebacterium crudilactis]